MSDWYDINIFNNKTSVDENQLIRDSNILLIDGVNFSPMQNT